jgi:hypothetical protein
MKPTIKFIIILLFLQYGLSFQISAQVNTIGTFVSAGTEDGEKLIKGYLTPYLNAFGASMTGGWYNTAKSHKLGGFDLTVTLNTAIVPNGSKSFDVDGLGLTNLTRVAGSEAKSPTIAGNKDQGPMMQYNLNGYTNNAFELPKGTGNLYIPTPMLQMGIGLIKETEIIGRYMPTFSISGSKIGMWGIGIKHSVSQWIPVLKKVPVLHVSIVGGYTRLKSNVAIAVDPSDIGANGLALDPTINNQTWNDQQMKLETGSLTANLVISADLSVVSFYGGVGFASTYTNLKLQGNYPMITIDNDIPTVMASKDPIDIKVKNQDGGVTKPRYNLGMRLKLAIITIHFDYTRANYNVITAGLGISFR